MTEHRQYDMIDVPPGVEIPAPSVEPSPRWVRIRLGDGLVADSRNTQLLIQYGAPPMLPTYWFPREDVDEEALVDPSETPDGSMRWTVAADGRRVEAGAWTHPDPAGPFADLEGLVTFTWMDDLQWYEEDEPVFAHARDPHKRVDVAPSSRHVQVVVDDTEVADSSRPLLLFETTLPTRFYLPMEDVRMELLEPTDTTSHCPYKGTARYWSVRTGERTLSDLAWSYPDPIPENPRIKGLVSFFNERVDMIVDGVEMERPISPWS